MPATIVDDVGSGGQRSVHSPSKFACEVGFGFTNHSRCFGRGFAGSTVPASSRGLRRLRLVSGPAREPTESMGPDAVIHVIVDPDSEVLSDTATDPDLGARIDNVVQGEESDASSSGDDSVVNDKEAHDVVGDVLVPDTAWDELILDRATRARFASLDRVC